MKDKLAGRRAYAHFRRRIAYFCNAEEQTLANSEIVVVSIDGVDGLYAKSYNALNHMFHIHVGTPLKGTSTPERNLIVLARVPVN